MGNKLTSAQSLAYQGTNAASPSNVTVHKNRPTANFYQGFAIGDFWVYRVSQTSNSNELWVLIANNFTECNNGGMFTGNNGGCITVLAPMTAGDTATAIAIVSNSTKSVSVYGGDKRTHFSGFLIC